MKQHWLFKPPSANESVTTLEYDAPTHDELVSLMAKTIESLLRQQATLPQPTKEASDERITTTSQD